MTAAEARKLSEEKVKILDQKEQERYNALMIEIKKRIMQSDKPIFTFEVGSISNNIKERLKKDGYVITEKQSGFNEYENVISW